MKKILYAAIMVTLGGCMNTSTDQKGTSTTNEESIKLAGTYHKKYKVVNGTVDHTVQIKQLPGEQSYQVITTKLIDGVWDGKVQPTQKETPPPKLATFDPQRSVLLIEGEPTYSVDLENATLTKGNVVLLKSDMVTGADHK